MKIQGGQGGSIKSAKLAASGLRDLVVRSTMTQLSLYTVGPTIPHKVFSGGLTSCGLESSDSRTNPPVCSSSAFRESGRVPLLLGERLTSTLEHASPFLKLGH